MSHQAHDICPGFGKFSTSLLLLSIQRSKSTNKLFFDLTGLWTSVCCHTVATQIQYNKKILKGAHAGIIHLVLNLRINCKGTLYTSN